MAAFTGGAAWTGYPMVRGHWYTSPGQADVPADFLTQTGTTIGDTLTIDLNGRQVPVRIVGEIFDAGLVVITDSRTLASPGHPPRTEPVRRRATPGEIHGRLRAGA